MIADTATAIQLSLPTGELRLVVDPPGDRHVDDYCTFAARDNARRGYLFVSKVLGKHYAARPGAMRRAHDQLASMVPVGDQDRIAVVGMAETATGLGYGVFEALLRAHPDRPAAYAHTTRYWMHEDVLTFEETHSHAPSVCLHAPQSPTTADLQRQANLLVLVDDELSTGNTFSNLLLAYRERYPGIERVHVATLTDFSGGSAQRTLAARTGLPVSVGALLTGTHSFESRGTANPAPELKAQPRAFRRNDLPSTFGRGWTHRPLLPTQEQVASVAQRLRSPTGPVLVLGTGEFMHAAYSLALALERHGLTTYVQSTTRSPILTGLGISTKLEVPDAYLEDVPNYLYNHARDRYSDVLICHETSENAATATLAQMLDAQCIQFGNENEHDALSIR